MAMRSIRQLRTQTVPLRPEADAPYLTNGPDDPNPASDPLGIGVQTRARDADMAAALAGEPGALASMITTPLSWKGFFQTLKEKNARIGGIEGLPNVGAPSTAGDELADVAASMSGQPGSIQALRYGTQQAAKKKAAEQAAQQAAQPQAPQPPPAPPAPPRPGTAPQQLDPTLARDRYQAQRMQPGSLAALRRTLYEGD